MKDILKNHYYLEREQSLHVAYQCVIQKPVMAGDSYGAITIDSASTCSLVV
jgi:hypothetical protein